MTTASRTWLFADYNQAESRVVARRGPVPLLDKWYREGQDVHLKVTAMIAKVIQENHIKIPNNLFTSKSPEEYKKGDEEREQCKRIVHGYNYKTGKRKVALILGIPEAIAEILLTIYGKLFPEIQLNYHIWIETCIKKTRMLLTPSPVEFRRVFWDVINDDLYRQAYAAYPQIVVSRMLNNTLAKCARIFKEDQDELLKDQWCAWYGPENYDNWRHLRDAGSSNPQAIRWAGMDIRLNVHDAGGISVPDDPDLVHWTASTWKRIAEVPIYITKEDPLIIPVDFKKGPTWGNLEDYKLIV